MISQVFRLIGADLKRFISSPKAILMLLFSTFFAWDFVRVIEPYAEGMDVAVTPWVYPIFLDDWGNSLYILLLICVLMSDAPFRNGSELYLRFRISKYIWIVSKAGYILTLSFLYQALLAVLCALVFAPQIGLGFSTDWGYVLRTYYSSTGGMLDASGNTVDSSLLSYSPASAVFLQILLATLVSAMLGMLMLLLNCIFRNYTGTVLVSILSCTHLILEDFGFYNIISFNPMLVPTSWIRLGDLFGKLSPYVAAGILTIILTGLIIIGALLLKLHRFDMCV